MQIVERNKGIFRNSDLFYIFIYANVFCKSIGLNNSSYLYTFILLVGGLLIICKILNEKYTQKEVLFITILVLTALLSVFISHKPTFALTCFCLIGMKNINTNKIIRNMFNIRFVTYLLMNMLSLLGFIENRVTHEWRMGKIDTRYGLGYGHPNVLHMNLVLIVATYIYKKKGKINIYEYIAIILMNLIIYKYSISRTGFSIVIIMVILNILTNSIRKLKKENFFCIIPLIALILFVAASFITAYLYKHIRFIDVLNNEFNNRIAYNHYYLMKYDFSIFGHSGVLLDENAQFDNSYVFVYVQYGIVVFLMWLFMLYKICINISIEKDLNKSILVISMLVYMLIESFGINIFMNFILLFFSDTIFHNEERGIKYGNNLYSDIQ